jgi:hypothetical protein
VLVLKKQQLIWAIVIVAVIIASILLFISIRNNDSSSTASSQNKYSADLNNDGKDDSIVLYTDEETDKYTVNIVISNGKGFTLEPDPTIKSLGYCKEWWSMSVSVKDVNKDNVEEVILQSADETGPILHIFRYDSNTNTMKRLTSGRYSMYGTMEEPSIEHPVIVLGYKLGEEMKFTYLDASGGKLSPYTSSAALTLGKDAISSVLTLVENKDVEASTINIDSKCANKLVKGEYLDCSLYDAKYTKFEVPSECTYIMRTAVTYNELKECMVYKIKMTLESYENKVPVYRISSVSVLP